MIRILLLSIPIVFFLSCKSDHKPSTDKPTAKKDTPASGIPVPFAGDWISEHYYQTLMASQSPRKAQKDSKDCFIHIPEKTLQPTTMAFNFHESGSTLVVRMQNDTFTLWETQNDSLIKPAYAIEILSPDKIKLGDNVFIKITPMTIHNRPGILEETLFKGLYEIDKGQLVEFKNNGEVSGFGKYKYYVPLIDYFDAGLQIDQVGLGETKDKLDYYGFKFRKNGLDLFAIKCKTYDNTEKRCVDADFGKKIYDLKKRDNK